MKPMRKTEVWTPERIKALRKRFCEKQAAFADRLGISLPTLKAWETRGNVPLMACKFLSLVEKAAPAAEPVPA